jgi:signal transduction histidine kinase/ligand-binding sensor domain-containing protein
MAKCRNLDLTCAIIGSVISISATCRNFSSAWSGLARAIAACWLIVAALANPAFAQTQPLAQMDHTSWTARDGAPQGVLALAQARDGTLWIGSEAGLVNFDGRTFTPFKAAPGEAGLPFAAVYSVLVDKDDALWVGTLYAGVAHIANGHVTLYQSADKVRLGLVQSLTQAADGSIWGLDGARRLVRFGSDNLWHFEPGPAPNSRINAIMIDSSNTLWVPEMGDHLYRRPLTQSSYIATDVPTSIAFGFTELRDGTIWMADVLGEEDRGRTQHFDRLGHLIQKLPGTTESFAIKAAADDTLILGTQGQGLHRVSPADAAALEAYTTKQGLSSDEVHAILLDRDGNLWTGGRRGLDRFKRARLVHFAPGHPSTSYAVCGDPDGTVWIAQGEGPLYRALGAEATVAAPDSFYSISCGREGDVWLAGHTGLWHVHQGRMLRVPDIPGVRAWSASYLESTTDQTLYARVSTTSGKAGTWQFKNGRWSEIAREGPLGASGAVAYVDSHDRLWKGYGAGLVGLPLENRLLNSGEPGLGVTRDIRETSYGLLAAGNNGVAILRDDHFQMLSFVDDSTVKGIAGILESPRGDVWINAAGGIVHVSADEMRAGLDKPGYKMKSDLITEGDFIGAPQDLTMESTVAQGRGGDLWFVTVSGVVHIDSEHWQAPSHAPILSLKSITVDRQPLGEPPVIGPRPDNLEVRYLGVNLTAPERVIYRYRLDGFDDKWQEVGNRTEAIYTHLPAGNYVFNVMASNGDGAWSAPVSTRPFRVLPSFYRTTWFAVLCACSALALLWVGFRIRLRAMTREVRARAEERADERIRIARELHDTLLQGVQGLLLTFHVASQKIPVEDSSKAMLDKALSTADRIIIEGRNRVSRLRMEHLGDAELLPSIENVCNDLSGDGMPACRISRTGQAGPLRSYIADEIFYIAREALTNAFRHSQAALVTLELEYGRRYFAMRCHDAGRGFAPEQAEKAGHWGLRGMTERVRKLGGRLRITSAPGRGAEILVSIPSFRAYQHASRLMFYLRALF